MHGRNPAVAREAPRLRWARVATLAAVALLHVGFLALLLAPVVERRRRAADTPPARADALQVRMLPPRRATKEPPPPAAPRPVQVATREHAPRPVARPIHPAVRAVPPAAPAVPRADDSLIVSAPSGYVAGGGRLSGGSDYGRQNVRVPGNDQPVRGTPMFRMADPRWQGIAGVVRTIGSLGGAIDSHCPRLEAVRGMTVRERLANHVEADDAKLEAEAARYGCPEPLKPGAAMYYFAH